MKAKKKADPIEIGDIIETIKDPFIVGEIFNILEDRRETVQVIVYDKRLKPLTRYDGDYRIKRVRKKHCKHFNFKEVRQNDSFEIGDIVEKTHLNGFKRYGILVGFVHPDEIATSSYYNGYNGVDFLQCVEINKRGLERKRRPDGTLKRFNTSKHGCVICRVDPLSKKGLRLIVGNRTV